MHVFSLSGSRVTGKSPTARGNRLRHSCPVRIGATIAGKHPPPLNFGERLRRSHLVCWRQIEFCSDFRLRCPRRACHSRRCHPGHAIDHRPQKASVHLGQRSSSTLKVKVASLGRSDRRARLATYTEHRRVGQPTCRHSGLQASSRRFWAALEGSNCWPPTGARACTKTTVKGWGARRRQDQTAVQVAVQ